jgi:hypothetical protein
MKIKQITSLSLVLAMLVLSTSCGRVVKELTPKLPIPQNPDKGFKQEVLSKETWMEYFKSWYKWGKDPVVGSYNYVINNKHSCFNTVLFVVAIGVGVKASKNYNATAKEHAEYRHKQSIENDNFKKDINKNKDGIDTANEKIAALEIKVNVNEQIPPPPRRNSYNRGSPSCGTEHNTSERSNTSIKETEMVNFQHRCKKR